MIFTHHLKTIRTILIGLVCISFAKTAPLSVAVNDLTGTGISSDELTLLSQRLRSELFKTGSFQVMERAEMQAILQEQGFQQSGACDESSCMVEAGKLLGVSNFIAGSVGKVESNFYTVSLRMICIETGAIVKTADLDFRGSISGLLSKGIAQSAQKMTGSIEPTVTPKYSTSTTQKTAIPHSEAVAISAGDVVLGITGSSTWPGGMQSNPGFLNADMGGGVTLSMAVHPFVDYLSVGFDLGMMWCDEQQNQSWDSVHWNKKSSKTQIGFTLDFHPFGTPSVIRDREKHRKADFYFGIRFGPNYYDSKYTRLTTGSETASLPTDSVHSDFFVDGHLGLNIMLFKNVGMKMEWGSDRAQWLGVVARIPTRKNRGKE